MCLLSPCVCVCVPPAVCTCVVHKRCHELIITKCAGMKKQEDTVEEVRDVFYEIQTLQASVGCSSQCPVVLCCVVCLPAGRISEVQRQRAAHVQHPQL